MFGDPIRKTPDGRGIPTVRKLSWTSWDGSVEEYGVSWYVTYPDPSKGCGFDCCGLTVDRMFDAWRDALAFALARSWETDRG